MKLSLLLGVCLLAFCVRVAAEEGSQGSLQLKQTIALPGVEGRIDHMDLDGAGDRLFVCALGNNTVEVLDLRSAQRIHSITGLGAPQGIVFLPESKRIFVANDKAGLCKFYDANSYAPTGELNLKDDADNVRYDAASKLIYVGFGAGGIAIVSAQDGKSLGSIKLADHPEAFEVEKRGHRIFVNVPNAGHVAVIDRDKGEVIATWKTGGASANFPMALDETNDRLFVGCRSPSQVLVLNTESGAVVTKIDISGDPDELFYDSKRHRIYAICGGGTIDVVEQTDANIYKAAGRIVTRAGARTGLFVPERDSLFVAAPRRDSQQAEIRRYELR